MDEEQLRARLQLLEDERAILAVLHAYGHAIDYGDEERYLDLWTHDAAFDARGRVQGDVSRVVRGREALADFAAHFSRPPQGWHKHLVIEPLIEVEGDAASATSYFAVLRDEGNQPTLWVFGRYRDTLVRCADGRWRFSLRIAEVESVDKRYPSLAFVR
jgi:ketosteroid isomerase-like protein